MNLYPPKTYQPHSTRRTLQTGLCPCNCGGDIGYRPLFAWEEYTDEKGKKGRRQTDQYRTEKSEESLAGRPLARTVIICRHDAPAIAASLEYEKADSDWKHDRKMKMAVERKAPLTLVQQTPRPNTSPKDQDVPQEPPDPTWP